MATQQLNYVGNYKSKLSSTTILQFSPHFLQIVSPNSKKKLFLCNKLKTDKSGCVFQTTKKSNLEVHFETKKHTLKHTKFTNLCDTSPRPENVSSYDFDFFQRFDNEPEIVAESSENPFANPKQPYEAKPINIEISDIYSTSSSLLINSRKRITNFNRG
jgi:hypothetical protein